MAHAEDNAIMVKMSKSQTNKTEAEAKAKVYATQSPKRYLQGNASCASLLLMAAMAKDRLLIIAGGVHC